MSGFRTMFRRQWHALIGLHDTPHSIAGGVAIGIFFGFTPLFGFKTLLGILIAWVFRCSRVAAAVAVNLHDITLPLLPVILRLEYGIGFCLLRHPHQWPPKMKFSAEHLGFEEWFHWSSFVKIGLPMLVGSVFVGGLLAAISFFITLPIVTRYQARRDALRAGKSSTNVGTLV